MAQSLDAAGAKVAMIGFLEKVGPEMAALRDKEWVSDELNRLKNQGRVTRGQSASQIKPTGIVRKVDELGRVVIPIELRRAYGIGPLDPVEVYVDPITKFICIGKYEKQCHWCSGTKDITEFKGKYICEACIGEFAVQVVGIREENENGN